MGDDEHSCLHMWCTDLGICSFCGLGRCKHGLCGDHGLKRTEHACHLAWCTNGSVRRSELGSHCHDRFILGSCADHQLQGCLLVVQPPPAHVHELPTDQRECGSPTCFTLGLHHVTWMHFGGHCSCDRC